MGRIAQCFTGLKNDNRTALIPFITAGYPDPQVTVMLMHGLVSGGADLIELGIPFSDPMADGPVIQRASEQALVHHTNLETVLDMVHQFRGSNRDTPVILMGYLNPVEALGYGKFCTRASESGVDGVLIVDLPPEEAGDFNRQVREQNLDQIFLLSPTTSNERIKRICAIASGFIYYVALKGVTGSNRLDVSSVDAKLQEIRPYTSLPIGVGFGIRDVESARQISRISDAVILGSVLIEKIAELAGDDNTLMPGIELFIASMRSAIDSDD